MIENSKQNNPLNVCLDDAGTHNKAILDFFFAKLGQNVFRCVDSQEKANVVLIDYDFPPARQKYEEEYQQWGKPALVLSISEVSLENAIWLAKPLTSRSLLDAAETLQKQLANSGVESTADKTPELHPPTDLGLTGSNQLQPPVQTTQQRPPEIASLAAAAIPLVKKVDEDSPDLAADEPLNDAAVAAEVEKEEDKQPALSTNLDTETHENEQTSAETKDIEPTPEISEEASKSINESRTIKLCGDKPDIAANSDLKDFYTDDSFFLSSLKDAIRLARQCQQGVLLNFPKARIYVLPEIHRVFCGINIYEDEFLDLIKSCTISEGGKMHILSTQEIHELNDMISQQASALYDMEAFVWTSTLLSAQGGLPRTLDPKKVVGLKHWPSLTRLENFPHAMPIAAQWSSTSMNAFDVAKSLNIPQRYVFSFYNATNSLGLIEQDPEKLITKKSVPRSKDAPRGLFSRLLKRLVGG